MRNTFALSLLSLFLVSCQEKTKEAHEETTVETKQEVIVHEEYTQPEPTEPEGTEYYEPKVPVVGPASNDRPPSDAIILFNGSSFDGWMHVQDSTAVKWHLNEDGSMTVADKTGDIRTKQEFGDMQLHIEWRSPLPVQREGQNRGNSGVFLNGMYEIQVLDNNENDTYVNGQVGAIYKQGPPLAMASVPTGEWNVYDIIYHAPEFNTNGEKIKSGTVTVLHNGVLIQDHTEIKGTTPYIGWPKNPSHGKGPLKLQDHGDDSRVSYRNIWVREL
ncbi:MAG: DUF1080 domain-containing protein [Maribacter sp.]